MPFILLDIYYIFTVINYLFIRFILYLLSQYLFDIIKFQISRKCYTIKYDFMSSQDRRAQLPPPFPFHFLKILRSGVEWRIFKYNFISSQYRHTHLP